nr:helix-turn-helix domain-containing protein [Flavonifractor plautii]
MAQNPGQVFSYEQLHNEVWRAPINQGLHDIQVCMARVRQKLERLCPDMHYIETVRRKGYRFRPQERS